MEQGKLNTLTIARLVSPGAILNDEEGNEVLLPSKFVTEEMKPDDQIEVFLYTDSEDRIVATTREPYVQIGEFAFLEVVDTTQFGAFVDWGLEKDLFVSLKNQKQRLQVGQKCFITPYYDEFSNRMCGTTKIGFLINNDELTVNENDAVEAIVFSKTDLGYNAIINKKHWGLIFRNEVFQPLQIGDTLSAFVKNIREDNKIDLVLQKSGREQIDSVSENILNVLKENNGFLALTDKSSPEEIYQLLKISKKNFKKAIGGLYKQRMINLEEKGIKLL